MRKKPWVLIVLAGLHVVAPIGNVTLNALLMERNVLDYFAYAMQMQYLQRNWIILVAPFVAGVAIYACKKWSFFVYIVSITALFAFSYAGYMSKADSISIVPVLFVYFVNVAVVGYFLLPAVREVYFDPGLRWWESQPRYRSDFECTWQKDEQSGFGNVGNFSINGLFLKSSDFPNDGSMIDIHLKNTSQGEAHFKGMTILHRRQGAIGFGVQFEHTNESMALAKAIVSDLDKQGVKMVYRAPNNEDSFLFWLKNLFTTSQGILPKKDK